MQTGKNTMRGLFDGSKVFNIPIYQRAYAWKEPHLNDFLADIVNQRHDNSENEVRQYFLGTFLLHKRGSDGDFIQYDVIDGQQRLTTFSIFMYVLLLELEKRESDIITKKTKQLYIKDDDVYKLILSNEDGTFFSTYILSDDQLKIPHTEYKSQQRLIEAKSFFQKSLKCFDIVTLEKIFKTATDAEILLYVVNHVSSATQIFELLNDRGKKLTDLEAIKSFLMYNITSVSSTPDRLIKDIQNHFSAIYRIIENNKLKSSDESNVLRYNVISSYKMLDIGGKDFVKETVSSLINAGKKEEAKEFIITYPQRLRNTFELYAEINNNEQQIASLDKLKEIGRVAPFYPIMIYCLENNRDQFEEMVNNLTQFTFRASLVGLRSNGEGHLNKSLKDEADLMYAIKEMVQYNWWNINARVDSVLEFQNFYEWVNKNIVKYILVSYENHLRKIKGFEGITISEYFNNDDRTKLSIEHISAQKAKSIVYDQDFNENYLHNIGNLVIDSASSNSRKSNKNTNDKASELSSAPLMSQNEIDIINVDWTNIDEVKLYIRKREKILKEFIRTNLLK